MSELKVEVDNEAQTATPVNDKVAKEEATSVPALEKSEDVKIELKVDKDVKAETNASSESGDVKVESKAETKVEEANGKSGTKEETKEEDKPVRKYDNGVLKTSRQIDHKNFHNNSKYDPSVLPETDDAQAIRNQVEFYFSDSNLPTDKHMWEMTDGATNLPISIENICKFGRMKRFKPVSAVVAALRESAFLEVIGAEGQEQVKRKTPYDPSLPQTKSETRSVYVKGFGDEEPSSQFDIEAFFAQYGPTRAVRLRRTDEKLFKGSVFVEFDNDELAEKFLALDPAPLWKGKHELLIQSKRAYQEKKNEEIREGTTQPKKSWTSEGRGRGGFRGRGGRGNHRGDGDNRGRRDRDSQGDRDNWKERRAQDQANGFRGDRDSNDWKKRRDNDHGNNFKDHKNGRDGKFRGRGGHRDNRGGRNNDRDRDHEDKNGDKTKVEADTKPKVEAPSPENNEKKRAREDDDVESGPSAKKVDSKPEVATEAS